MDCLPCARPSTLARAGRQACAGIGRGLTAGWALRCWFWALYGVMFPGEVLLEMLQKRGAVGGDARSENVRWTFSAQNARPVGGPGDGRFRVVGAQGRA